MKRRSIHIYSFLIRLHVFFSVLPTLHAQNAIEGSQPVPDIELVVGAWEKRGLAVKTCEIKVTTERTIPGSGIRPQASDDLFADPEPEKDLVSTVKGEYFFDGKKTGMVIQTDRLLDPDNPENLVSQRISATFDGRENRDLIVQDGQKQGMIEISGVASGKLLANVDFMALDLWLRPEEFLGRAGWSTTNMELDSKDYEVDGVKCWRVLISHRKAKCWSAALDVDPNRDCVPILFQTWLNGSPRVYMSMRYDTRQNEPSIRDWSYTHYHKERGEVLSNDLRRATVQSCKINSPIDKARFTVEFQLGTHVVQSRDGVRTYFIQTGEGLRPIESGAFGKLQSNEDAI